jgi:hypothetical protein
MYIKEKKAELRGDMRLMMWLHNLQNKQVEVGRNRRMAIPENYAW